LYRRIIGKFAKFFNDELRHPAVPDYVTKWPVGISRRAVFWFAQRSGRTRPAVRSRRHPDQGEDNPNRKGVGQ
jgi:hypothetical protein